MLMLMLLVGCANTDKAVDHAGEWVTTNKPAWTLNVPPDCSNKDSNNDGKVSCTVILVKGDVEETIKLECPAGWLPQPIDNKCKLGGSGG